MLVRSRRATAVAIGATLLAFATACTNPTAPAATSNHAASRISGDGVVVGSGGRSSVSTTTDDGVVIGSGG